MSFINYKNGNYRVFFNTTDGTKIRDNGCNKTFEPTFAENCDVMISTMCNNGCKYCYAGCNKTGKFGNLSMKFLDTLHPYTEMAMNLNFPIHPDMIKFLGKLKNKEVFANITINQNHFMENYDFVKTLVIEKLVYGIGISLTNPNDEFLKLIKTIPNVVIHVINGIVTKEQIEKLKNHHLKLLVLGYKTTGRGNDFLNEYSDTIKQNQSYLYDNIYELRKNFDVISFDNLALSQLNFKRFLSDKEWDEFYMGDDGTTTFAIDLVKETFSPNSTSDIHIPIGDLSIDEMFATILDLK